MDKTIHVRVVTNEGQAVSDEAVSVVAPGELGYLGMLHNHAPLVSTVTSGRLTWRRSNGKMRMLSVGPGLLEIAKNTLTLLTSSVEESSSSDQS